MGVQSDPFQVGDSKERFKQVWWTKSFNWIFLKVYFYLKGRFTLRKRDRDRDLPSAHSRFTWRNMDGDGPIWKQGLWDAICLSHEGTEVRRFVFSSFPFSDNKQEAESVMEQSEHEVAPYGMLVPQENSLLYHYTSCISLFSETVSQNSFGQHRILKCCTDLQTLMESGI